MIAENEQPVWFDYIEYDNNLRPYLRDDAPQKVKEAYAEHLAELQRMSELGENVSR